MRQFVGCCFVGFVLVLGGVGCGGDGDDTGPGDPAGMAGATAVNGIMPGTAGMAGMAGSAGTSGNVTMDLDPPSMAGTGGTTAAAPSGDPQDALPCGVSSVLKNNCQTCHAATPIGGAPMPLVTFADLQQPAKTQPTMKVYELVKQRIHDPMKPMPPTTQPPLSAVDLSMLDAWLDAGALAATAGDAEQCPTEVMDPPVEGRRDGGTGPLVAAPGETCYDFKVHQSTTSVDDVKYDVVDGEHYEQFYYEVPWPKDTVATAYGTKMDNLQVLHHWLLFATNELAAEGFHKTAPLPTLIGTNPILLAGWAVGGPNLVAPDGVGFELPDPGATINVQWHFYNSTGSTQQDASTVQICTVPKAMRQNVGGITWLGTEDLGGTIWTGGPGMPAGQESTFTTTCTPGRAGLAPDESIHIIGFEPHMHRIGKRMKTDVVHTDGTMETIFDKPFNFGEETHYYQDYELKPGEKLVTSCTFNNTNDYGVPFGESSDAEMCYQFVFSWPAHALTNGAFSLLGVPDTCW